MKTWAYGERVASADINGNFAEVGTKRGAAFIQSGTAPVPNQTVTNVSLVTESTGSDPGGWLTASPSVNVKPPAGWYLISAEVSWSGNVAARRQLIFLRNGTTIRQSNLVGSSAEGGSIDNLTAGPVYFDGSQNLTVAVQQFTGASQTISTAYVGLVRVHMP